MALIKCEKVSVGYEGRTVLKDLDFQIDSGDYLCIVGENGSGKSTLVKSILGLKMIEKGRILFGDGLKPVSYTHLDVYKRQSEQYRDVRVQSMKISLQGRSRSSLMNYASYQSLRHRRSQLKKMQRQGKKCA